MKSAVDRVIRPFNAVSYAAYRGLITQFGYEKCNFLCKHLLDRTRIIVFSTQFYGFSLLCHLVQLSSLNGF